MFSDLSKRVVLVTGAAGGIGSSVARAMAEAGAKVIAVDLEDTGRQGYEFHPPVKNIHTATADISDESEVTALFDWIKKRHHRLDVLVHCAGIIHEAPLLNTSLSDFDRIMAINLRGAFLIGRETIRMMESRRDGRVILIASDLSHMGRETFSPYVASKHGVLGLVRSWAIEFAPGILVNAICPGPIKTTTRNADSIGQEWRDRDLDIPLRRMGEATEIAAMALFLSGPGGNFITGQSINVNGGSVMM